MQILFVILVGAILLGIVIFPAIALYAAAFFALRFLFRRLRSRRSKYAVAAIVIVAALIPSLVSAWTYLGYRRWAVSETVGGEPIRLTARDSVALTDSTCRDICRQLLTRGGAGSVIVKEGSMPSVRWTLIRDPAVCGTPEAQAAVWNRGSNRALLAQGYCLQAQPTDETATYTVRADGPEPYYLETNPYRFTRFIVDSSGNVVLRRAYWRFSAYISPPIPLFNVLRAIFPESNPKSGVKPDRSSWSLADFNVGISKHEIHLLDDPRFLEDAFGRKIIERDRLGPVLIEDPRAAIASAARSPSPYMQGSALALICALGWERRDESMQDIELLRAAEEKWVQALATRLGDWRPDGQPCSKFF